MRGLIRTRPIALKRLGAATVLLLTIGGGVAAFAATGSSLIGPHGNINSCVPLGGGEVNVWEPGHRCSPGRVALAWPASATGAKGATGGTGATGASGATGATGATGASNPDATTVNGQTVTKLAIREATPATGTTSQTFYAANGLTILAECDSAGHASLVANGPQSADSELTVSGQDNTGGYGSQTGALAPTSLAPLGPSGSGEASFSYASNAGRVTTGTVGYQSAPSFGTFAGCAFFGSVISG